MDEKKQKVEVERIWLKRKEELNQEEAFNVTSLPWFNPQKKEEYKIVFDIQKPKKIFTHWMGDRRIKCPGGEKCSFNHEAMPPDLTWNYRVAILDKPSDVFVLHRLSLPTRAGYIINRIVDQIGKIGLIYTFFKEGESVNTIYALKINAQNWKGKNPFYIFTDKSATQEQKEKYILSVDVEYATDKQFNQLDLVFNYTKTNLVELDEDIPF